MPKFNRITKYASPRKHNIKNNPKTTISPNRQKPVHLHVSKFKSRNLIKIFQKILKFEYVIKDI